MEEMLRKELAAVIRKTITPLLKKRECLGEPKLVFPFPVRSLGERIGEIFDPMAVEEIALAIEEFMDMSAGKGRTTPDGMSSDILYRLPSMDALVRYVWDQVNAACSVNWELEEAARGTI